MSIETDNPLNELDDENESGEVEDVEEGQEEEEEPVDVPYQKLGLKTEFKEGDVDALIHNWCQNAHNSSWLDTVIIVAILINTVILAVQNPATTLPDETLTLFMLCDVVLTATFSWEMFVRIIAMGFYNPKYNSNPKYSEGQLKYLNDAWNKLDFAVVLSSWLNVLVEATGMKLPIELSTLRALRVLRVLRSLRMFSGIKTILSVVAQAIPYSVNVLAFLGFLFVVCGIIGIQMFRGHTLSRCEWGGGDLQAELSPDKYPLNLTDDGTWVSVLGDSSPGNKPLTTDGSFSEIETLYVDEDGDVTDPYNYCQSLDPLLQAKCPVLNRTTAAGPQYEYPIGIGMWWTYCTVDEDCPMYGKMDPYNRTQVCVPSQNPGKTFHHYDTVLDGWIALFINMACLYWWETAHRFVDSGKTSPNDLGAIIAWGYGALNILLLTYVCVNMFVAVITTVFADVRSAENPDGGMVEKKEKGSKKAYREKWTKPFYYVAALGGPDGPYEERKKKGEQEKERLGLINGAPFNNFIMFFIMFNTVILAMDHHNPRECISNTRDFGAVVKAENGDRDWEKGVQVLEVWDEDEGGHFREMCQTETFIDVETYLNYLFNFVFTMELVLKVLGMGFRAYIREPFNKLDFFIVSTSILDMVGEALTKPGDESTGLGSLKMFRILRLFRVLRVARFLYKNKNLKRVLQTVFGSGEALGNLGLFIFFSIMLFGIMGMHLFGGNYHPMNERLQEFRGGYGYCEYDDNVDSEWPDGHPLACYADNSGSLWGRMVGDGTIKVAHEGNKISFGYNVTDMIKKGLIPRRNFEDMGRSFLMAFQVMTGDDWVNQMHDHLELFNGWTPAILYFFNFSFCNFILLSLFIAVILENFEVAEAEKMKMQKEQRKTKIEMEEEERRKPKITFMHRLTFCCGGQGKGDKFMSADLDEFGKSTTLNIHPLNGKILALDDPMGNLLQKALDAGVPKEELRSPVYELDDSGEPVRVENENGVKELVVKIPKDDWEWSPERDEIIEKAVKAGADVADLEAAAGLGEPKWYNDDKALFVFGPDHPAAQFGRKVANNAIFSDIIVLGAILIGTILLIWEGPAGSLPPDLVEIFDIVGTVLYLIFLAEFVFKVLGYGLFFTPDAYIKNPWNKLDFVVIIGSTITIFGGNAGPIRLLRCLRPLRIVARNEGMRVIITAVVSSLAVNIGVLALAGMGILMFSILGVALFGGKFYSCNCMYAYPLGVHPDAYTVDHWGVATFNRNSTFEEWQTDFNSYISATAEWRPYSPCYEEDASKCNTTEYGAFPANATADTTFPLTEILDRRQCEGEPIGEGFTGFYPGKVFGVDPNFPNAISQCYWDNRPYNFDTIGSAMNALFTASTLAGWTDIMEIAMDMRGIDMQPVPFASWWNAWYFLLYVLIMAFFVTNLFIGVLIDFIGHSDGSALLTEDQQKLQDMDKFQKLHRPMLKEEPPSNCIRRWFFGLVESMFWNNLSNGVIIFNVVVMLCETEGQTHETFLLLEFLNYFCLIFFTWEMAFKVIAYFPIKYWKDPWSKFDCVVITFSWAAIFFDLGSVQAIRAMRAFRIVLVLKSAKGIRSLFQTLMLSVAPAVNISVLLLILYSMYAILGMQLWGNAPLQDIECLAPRDGLDRLGSDSSLPGGVLGDPIQCDIACDDTPRSAAQKEGENPADCVPCTIHFCDVGTEAGVNPDYWEANPGLEAEFEDISKAFAGLSGGKPGHMLMGTNRQYTHHSSFRNYVDAMKLLFQVASGQDWKFVMYAVAGEPNNLGQAGSPGLGIIFFASFFFLSNYILLNLFIAVILDNFAASMREQELDISEQDFEEFKYMFRMKTTEESPEILLWTDVWPLLAEVGATDGHDDIGNVTENPFSPVPADEWEVDNMTAWKLRYVAPDPSRLLPVYRLLRAAAVCSLPSATVSEMPWGEVKTFVQRLYDEGHSPINAKGQPGYDDERGLDENGRRQEKGSFQVGATIQQQLHVQLLPVSKQAHVVDRSTGTH